jgi:predicted NBD/HSP70 family sugar kinase/biotin operon repressor
MPPLILSGSNGSTIKSNNIRALLMTLLRYESVSRVRLAQMTGVSPTTITNLVNELLEQGVIAEDVSSSHDERNERSERRGAGRPQTGLRIVPDARFVVAVHIDVDAVYIAVSDLFAQPVARRSFPLTGDISPDNVLPQITAMAREAMAESGVPTHLFIGAGVGASGLVDPYTGVNVIAPNLGWHNVPLCEALTEQLGLPVSVDNNVRAMALGEMLFGAGRGGHTLAFVYSRVGVGAGFVVGDQLYRGSGAGAGEIGHTTMIPDGGELCGCGNTGCLETLVSEPAIVRAAQRVASENPGGILAEALENGAGKPIERVFAAARAGDPLTGNLLEARAHYMGIALANLVNVLNPELIVMGGIFAQGQDVLLPTVEATMRARAFAGLGERVTLQTARPGAGITGAASLALNTFFYQQDVHN